MCSVGTVYSSLKAFLWVRYIPYHLPNTFCTLWHFVWGQMVILFAYVYRYILVQYMPNSSSYIYTYVFSRICVIFLISLWVWNRSKLECCADPDLIVFEHPDSVFRICKSYPDPKFLDYADQDPGKKKTFVQRSSRQKFFLQFFKFNR